MSEKKQLSEDILLEEVTSAEYKYGFTTKIESDTIPKGLTEKVVRTISAKKNVITFLVHWWNVYFSSGHATETCTRKAANTCGM